MITSRVKGETPKMSSLLWRGGNALNFVNKSNSQQANEKLNQEFYEEENTKGEETATEKANRKIKDRLESGEPSKGVDPDHYLANNENSLVTRGMEKKRK
jgi:hypothetical protein